MCNAVVRFRVVYPRCRRRYRRFVQGESIVWTCDPPEDIGEKVIRSWNGMVGGSEGRAPHPTTHEKGGHWSDNGERRNVNQTERLASSQPGFTSDGWT